MVIYADDRLISFSDNGNAQISKANSTLRGLEKTQNNLLRITMIKSKAVILRPPKKQRRPYQERYALTPYKSWHSRYI